MKNELKKEIDKFKEGIFALNTRRFGTVPELMIQTLYGLQDSSNLAYDKKDAKNNKVEVKFSRVMKQNNKKITKENVLEQIMSTRNENRVVGSKDNVEFDCNIQQIKTKEFDVLYYGMFYSDIIKIYKMNKDEVKKIPGYSDKQHRGNKGEGQFHINNKTKAFHEKYLTDTLTYDDLYEMFS